jgi:hypothetical protein
MFVLRLRYFHKAGGKRIYILNDSDVRLAEQAHARAQLCNASTVMILINIRQIRPFQQEIQSTRQTTVSRM